jgi:hypothetical protein
MEIIKIERKGKHLNTLERYHVYKISKEGIHMNDMHNETYNPIFELIHNTDTRRKHKQYKTWNHTMQRTVTSKQENNKEQASTKYT